MIDSKGWRGFESIFGVRTEYRGREGEMYRMRDKKRTDGRRKRRVKQGTKD